MFACDPVFGPVLAVAELSPRVEREFAIVPGPQARAAIAAALDIPELRKLRFDARLAPQGKRDWRLVGHLGATVVQACVVSLRPVVTRIEEDVTRSWIAGWQAPEGDEVELPLEVDTERLGAQIDLGAVMVEALALALPAWPRAEGAGLGEAQFSAPDVAPLTDADARPFAGLAALRDRLADEDGAEDGEEDGEEDGAD